MHKINQPHRQLLKVFATIVTLSAPTPHMLSIAARADDTRLNVSRLSDTQKATHVLNRLGFGPRPGEIERVTKEGVDTWIARQLQPEQIPDQAVEERLRPLVTLKYTPYQLMLAYEMDQSNFLRQARQKLLEQQRQAGADAATMRATRGNTLTPELLALLSPRERRRVEEARKHNLQPQDSTRAVGELQQERLIRAIHSDRQLQEVLVDFWSNHFNLDVKKGPVRALKIVDERDVIRPHTLGRFRDLLGASAKSPAMMAYLDNARSTVEMKLSPREQERLKQRLQRRAERQANQDKENRAAAPTSPTTVPAPAAMPALEIPTTRGGLNENYARELMELHSLGVDGGYTQDDVREVARCFTGWGLNPRTGEFLFRPQAHDDGEKMVLGQKIPAGGGIHDGERVLDILAAHPSTARFIARKLCMRFVADDPPASIIEKAAKSFSATQGDLREVVRTIVTSPEFFAPSAYRAKIKSPLEYAVSAVRACDGAISLNAGHPNRPMRPRQARNNNAAAMRARQIGLVDGRSSVRSNGGNRRFKTMATEIATMGQPLFSYQAPTGYPEDSRQWVSTGALIARLNYALALTQGQMTGVEIPQKSWNKAQLPAMEALEHLLQQLLQGDVSNGTRQALAAQVQQDKEFDAAKLAALIIGSPEFQRR